MFNVRLRKQLHSCFASAAGGDRWVEINFELSFAPFPGLHILKGDYEYDFKEVYYDLLAGTFKCYSEADQRYYDAFRGAALDFDSRATDKQMEDLVKEYVASGWTEEAAERGKWCLR
jgi:hypothetical protein